MTQASAFRYAEAYYRPAGGGGPTGAALAEDDISESDIAAEWPKDAFLQPDFQKTPEFRPLLTAAQGFLEGGKGFPKTRDLRLFARLALAEAGLNGAPGLARALDLMRFWMIGHWEAVHPQREAPDDAEFYERMSGLNKRFESRIFRLTLEKSAVAQIPGLGPITLRMCMIAAGRVVAATGESSPPRSVLAQALSQNPKAEEQFAAAAAAARAAGALLEEMQAFLTAKDGLFVVPEFGLLAKSCAAFAGAMEEIGGGSSAARPSDRKEPEAPHPPEGLGLAAPPAVAVAARRLGAPQSREDALRLLERAIGYYALHARSSPVPLALTALRDLMDANFAVWIKETAGRTPAEAALTFGDVKEQRILDFAASGADAAKGGLLGALERLNEDLAALRADRAWQKTFDARLEPTLDLLRREVLAAAGPSSVDIVSPQDRQGVKEALELVAQFWEREDPASAAPHYLRRIKGLVDSKFGEIVKTLNIEKGGNLRLPLDSL